MTSISLGKAGSIEVDESKFNDQVKAYIFNYGLKQMLNDVHAGEKDLSLKPALSAKKLASLYAGEVAQSRVSSGDAVMKEMRSMAEAELKAKVKAAGKKVSDFKPEVWKEVITKHVAAGEARFRAAAMAKLAIKVEEAEDDFDLESLIGGEAEE